MIPVTKISLSFSFQITFISTSLLVVKGVAMVAPLTLISDSKIVCIVFPFYFLLSIVNVSLMTMLKTLSLIPSKRTGIFTTNIYI